MDVIVSRSGGLAGLRLTWEVRVDEQPDAEDWYLLIEEIPWSQPPPVPPEPDRFVYRIRCAPHEATLAERQLVGPWRELVDRVQDASEPERGRGTGGAEGRRPPATPAARPTPTDAER
ncbi:protealysin inhibitor emfourin [Agromyces sp. NPDC004153]